MNNKMNNIVNDNTDKRKKINSLEYCYATRTDDNGKRIADDYRSTGGFLFKWEGTFWEKQDPELFEKGVLEWIGEYHPSEYSQRKARSAMDSFACSVNRLEEDKCDDVVIPCLDGWLLIDEDGKAKIEAPDKNRTITYKVNAAINAPVGSEYEPKALPADSMFKRFIESSLPDADTRALVQEYCGYSLTRKTDKQRFQMWIGQGGNGKSQLVSLLLNLHSNPVNVNLAKLEGFNSKLHNASFLYSTETSAVRGGIDEEALKKITDGEAIDIERKGKDSFTYMPTAKLLMLCNEFPNLSDLSDAIFRRLDLIEWNSSFSDSKDRIDDIGGKIWRDEADLFLSWCVEGLIRFHRNGRKFTVSEKVDAAKAVFRRKADKIRAWLDDVELAYDPTETEYTEKQLIYDNFVMWQKDNGYKSSVSSESFWGKIQAIFRKEGFVAREIRKGPRGAQIRVVPFYFKDKVEARKEQDRIDFEEFEKEGFPGDNVVMLKR